MLRDKPASAWAPARACTRLPLKCACAVQALRSLVDDAVYLDETAYTGAAKIAAYTHKIQV